ncbi:hypothetical protein [Demequina aestuarii]|uniref:hypothetical protein n=1 Tax=Demequina aestuarii TaxID=327095 RepID=UPI000783DD4C|nr:hypothetical protein [Demequina aestuarii]
MKRRILAAAAAVALAMGLSVTTASAAQLPVLAGLQTSVVGASACAPALEGGTPVLETTAPSGGSASAVALSGVPAECGGLAVELFVHDDSGAVIASGTGTAAGTVSVAVDAYDTSDAEAVVARIAGWIFPTTWTVPAPPPAATCVPMSTDGTVVAGSCSVTRIQVSEPWPDGAGQKANVYVSVTSAAPRFRITFNFAQAPFPGWTPVAVDRGNLLLAPGASCSTLPVYTMNGPTWSSSSYYFNISSNPLASASPCPGP